MEHQQAAPAAELMAAIERVRRLSNRLSRSLQQESGITIYQVGILAAVEEGARHLHEVADATGQPVSGASRLVDRLVNDGLLERRPDAEDRRAVVLALTTSGEQQLSDSRRLIGRVVNEALERMPSESARQLLPVLDRFLDAADGVLDEDDQRRANERPA